MSGLDQDIQITFNVNNSGIARQGFGLIGIPSHASVFTGRSKLYSRTADMITDGFPSDGPEVRAVSEIMSQTPHPPNVLILRVDGSLVIQKYEIDPVVHDEEVYELLVQGTGFDDAEISYTADADASAAEINNALFTQLNAVSDKNYTATFSALVQGDITFVGEADDDTLTAAAALVYADQNFTADNATEIFTKAAHGLLTGDGPLQVSNSGGALPTGLVAVTDYWVIKIDANTFYLATTIANALAGTHLSISTNGTGTQTISDTASTRRVAAHGLHTGDGPFQLTNSGGALPTGLSAATDYWFIRDGVYTFKLAASLALALAGTGIALSGDGSGIQTMSDTVDTVSPTSPLIVTGDDVGDWFSISVLDPYLIGIKQTHDDFDIGAELDAVVTRDNSFFWVHTMFNSKSYVEAVALWVQANGKAYFVDTNDTDAVQLGIGDSPTDPQFSLKALSYTRTIYSYHHRPAAMFSAGMMGLLAPKNPGTWNSKWKTVIGVEASSLDPNQRANLIARRANYYTEDIPGRPYFREGTVANGTYAFIDVQISLDWVGDDLRKALAGKFLSVDSIGFTDEDLSILVSAGKGTIKRATSDAYRIMAPGNPNDPLDPEPEFTVPRVADIDPLIRALREIPDSQLTFRLRGSGNTISVTATVTF